MSGKITHLQIIPQKSTQNTANLPLQTCDKNQWAFLLYNTGVKFSSCNHFMNLDSFAKVSIFIQSAIPGLYLLHKRSCLFLQEKNNFNMQRKRNSSMVCILRAYAQININFSASEHSNFYLRYI